MRRAFLLLVLVIISLLVIGVVKHPSWNLFSQAEKAASYGNWDRAIELYRAVADKYPYSRVAPRALFTLGDIYGFEKKDFILAMETYDAVIERYPQSRFVSMALLRKAEVLKERFQDVVGSMEVLSRIEQKYPSFEKMDYVYILMARCLEAVQDFTRERAYLRKLMIKYPDSPYAEEAHYLYAMACLGEGLVDEALLSFKNFFAKYPGSRFSARAEIGYAEALKEKHGKGEAIEYLAEVMDRYGEDDRELLESRVKVLKSRVPLSTLRIPKRRKGGRR